MLARLALLSARRASAGSHGLSALNVALPGCGVATASSASGALSFDQVARRGHASTSDDAASSSGHMPHLTRPSQDRRAETTKWSLLYQQGHDVNPCNSK